MEGGVVCEIQETKETYKAPEPHGSQKKNNLTRLFPGFYKQKVISIRKEPFQWSQMKNGHDASEIQIS